MVAGRIVAAGKGWRGHYGLGRRGGLQVFRGWLLGAITKIAPERRGDKIVAAEKAAWEMFG